MSEKQKEVKSEEKHLVNVSKPIAIAVTVVCVAVVVLLLVFA